jgi:hypothetical protein
VESTSEIQDRLIQDACSKQGEDIVCSSPKAEAGVDAHRAEVAILLDNKFDGDNMNVTLAIDNYLANLWKNLAPHTNVFTADRPHQISGNISIPKPVIATMSWWLEGEDQHIDPVKLQRFMALPDAV